MDISGFMGGDRTGSSTSEPGVPASQARIEREPRLLSERRRIRGALEGCQANARATPFSEGPTLDWVGLVNRARFDHRFGSRAASVTRAIANRRFRFACISKAT